MYATLHWACPYCGIKNQTAMEMKNSYAITPAVVICDSERGGCEGVVVLDATITITPRVRRIAENIQLGGGAPGVSGQRSDDERSLARSVPWNALRIVSESASYPFSEKTRIAHDTVRQWLAENGPRL